MKGPWWLVAAAALCAGCLPASHLVYVYEVAVGLDVACSTEGSGHVVLGYDRDTFALVPQSEDGGKIMSLAAVSEVKASGLSEVTFNHFVATGDAALGVARDARGLERIRAAIYGEEER